MTTSEKIITIRPITAQLTRNTDMFKNMDPYVKFKLGNNKAKSSVDKRAGKTPSWKDEILIKYMNEDTLKIEVWDKDTFKPDDLVGSTTLSLSTIEGQRNHIQDWIDLTYKGKDAGKILLDIQFSPKKENIQKQQVNVQKPGFNTEAPMPGLMAYPSLMIPPNERKTCDVMPLPTISVHQSHHSYVPQQQMFNNQAQFGPAQGFQPGHWPQNANFAWSTSMYVPQDKRQ